MNKKGFCTNCRFGSFLRKDEPCRNCVSIPSQFLSKEEITDADMPMGKKDREELIAYRKTWKELGKHKWLLVDFDGEGYCKRSYFLDDIKQKYFPKSVKESKEKITIDVDKLRSELIIMNEKLLRKYFPIKDGEVNVFDYWRKECS